MPYLLLCFAVVMTLTEAVPIVPPEEICTRWNRTCISEAECVNETCVCSETQHGDGLLTCADEDEHICLIRADPHIVSFGQARGDVPLPCRYRVARFTTPFSEKSLTWTCDFEVFAFNVISQSGRYFASGVEISFGVGDVIDNFIKFEISHGGISGSDGTSQLWGSIYRTLFNNVVIECNFDTHQNIATFIIKKCGTYIRFRPYDEDCEPGVQVRMPGIAIVTTKEANFDNAVSRYPWSLCGRPGDPDTLYEDRGLELTVNASTRAILYDVLEEGISQQLLIKDKTRLLLPNSAECSRVVKMFQTCNGVAEKARAIRVCAKILTARRLVQCLRTDVLETFIACMDAVCNDGSSCIILRGNINYMAWLDPVKCRAPKGVLESGICYF